VGDSADAGLLGHWQANTAIPIGPPGAVGSTPRRPVDDYGITFIRRHTVVGCEQVTVPAGTFVAVRIDVSQIQSNRPANAAMDWSLWYAPAVKFLREADWRPSNLLDPMPGFELESYTIDAQKPATQ